MKRTIGLFVFVLSVLLSGCVSYGYVAFERLEAGDVNYPEEIMRVGVVNNMPSYNFEGLDPEAGRVSMEGDGKIAADTLAHLLAASDYFNQVVLCDPMLQGENIVPGRPYALSAGLADSLMNELNVDMLFSLDRVTIDLSVDNGNYANVHTAQAVKSVITPVLFAYIPGRDTPWFAISDKDSLVYNTRRQMTYGRFRKEASVFSAYMLMEHLLPSWKTVERTYYASGCVELRDANVYMQEENWTDASRLWKQLYDKSKGKKKMMAAYNLAVYHEANDETELAEAYVEEALSLAKEGSYDAGMMRIYLMQLQTRLEKRRKLDVQMQRFK